MRDSGVSNPAFHSKRTVAGIMGIMMLVAVLFSAFYIAAESGHGCAGNDCPVCACIQQCENIFNHVCAGTAQASAAVPVVFLLLFVLFSLRSIKQETLVSRKVRLNN